MSDNHNLVSVIIPARNRPTLLARALISVKSQRHSPIEIIVVDDGSTPPIVEQLDVSLFDGVRFLRVDTSRGAAAARNHGLKESRGDFVAFLDDDDHWDPDKISEQLKVFSAIGEACGMVGCGFTYIKEQQEIAYHDILEPQDVFGRLLRGNYIGGCSVPLIRLDLLLAEGGFDESFESCQDWELWLRIARKRTVGFVNRKLVYREIHGGQITADVVRKISGREKLMEKFRADFDHDLSAKGEHLRRLGTLWLIAGGREKSRAYFSGAIDCLGFDWRAMIGLFLSYLNDGMAKLIARKLAAQKLGDVTFYH